MKHLGRDLMRPTKELFRLWARRRDGTLTREGFRRLTQAVRTRIDRLPLRGVFSGNAKLAGMCRPLYARRARVWTFVDVEGVEPTNNASERALRPAAIWRKLSFGTQRERGNRFVETILTVAETCRRQSRNIFKQIHQADKAHFANQRTPSLLSRA